MRLQTLATPKQLHTKSTMSKQLDGVKQKDIIPKVTGKIVKLWEAKEKEGKYGPYKIQNGDIEVDGDILGITFWDKEQNSSLKDKVVVISCTKGKHGLGGIELGHESYSKSDGTKVDRHVIHVKKAAKVELADGSAPEQVANHSEPSQPVRVSHSAITLEDLIANHILIDTQVREAYKDKSYDEETLRSYVASVFIEANKKGVQFKTEETSKQSVENDWASFIVPSGSMKGKKLIDVGKKNLIDLYHYYWKIGFNTEFAKAVEKAGQVFDFPLPDGDNIPMEDQPEIPW